jgi:hypothetical protein
VNKHEWYNILNVLTKGKPIVICMNCNNVQELKDKNNKCIKCGEDI